jgi:hypothetical protein
LLVDLLSVASDDAQKVALLSELDELGRSTPLGPLFSRERVGRVSILRDAVWATAASVGEESDYAGFALEAAFACYGTWMYGLSLKPTDRLIASCLTGPDTDASDGVLATRLTFAR